MNARYAMRSVRLWSAVFLIMTGVACHRAQPPVARPTPPPPPPAAANRPPEPPQPVREPTIVPPDPLAEDSVAARSLDELNRDSPLKPAFFEYDSDDLDEPARVVLQADAAILKRFSTWAITVEGHSDERGTAEYNLALGERRAVAARTYLVSLGIDANRLRIVSYGKEFPFDPAHDESAWSRNRRAHFVITAK